MQSDTCGTGSGELVGTEVAAKAARGPELRLIAVVMEAPPEAVLGHKNAEPCSVETNASRTRNSHASDWVAGYRAGAEAAIAEIDALADPCMQSFSAPLLARIRERLQQLSNRYSTEGV